MTIELRKFESSDIARLIDWIPDARFLLQWAGPDYTYPLNTQQLMKTLEKTKGVKPSHFMFKAINTQENIVIGHIELMAIDYEKLTATLGRILVGSCKLRGKGYGKQTIQAALKFGFKVLNLQEIKLGVFNFNTTAIMCYKKIGFQQYEIQPNARKFGEELWTLIMMKLTRENWNSQILKYC